MSHCINILEVLLKMYNEELFHVQSQIIFLTKTFKCLFNIVISVLGDVITSDMKLQD